MKKTPKKPNKKDYMYYRPNFAFPLFDVEGYEAAMQAYKKAVEKK